MFNIEPMVTVPTRITKSALDQMIVNKDFINCTVKILNSRFSDHLAQCYRIFTQTQINLKLTSKQKTKYTDKSSFSEENIAYFNYLLSKETWYEIYTRNTVNEAWKTFLDTNKYYLDLAIPKLRHATTVNKPK